MTRLLCAVLVLLLAGCVGMTKEELAECQHQVREQQAIKRHLGKIMQEAPYNSHVNDLAYLLYRHMATHTYPYYHESKLDCWEAP